MTTRRIEPAVALAGHIGVPGDKSISHRAVLLGAVGDGGTNVFGFGRSADTEATLAAVRQLGARVDESAEDRIVVHGVGLRGLRQPEQPIDCANSGTLLRLLSGLLAGQEGRVFDLTGDESLRGRPMERVAEPLRRMGAGVETTRGGAPVRVDGAALAPIDYRLPVASAQVKSAVLLAALYASGRTTVVEPAPARDHTELLLELAGARVLRRPASVSLDGPAERLMLGEVEVPGDMSAAAPFLVAAALIAGSELTVHGVGLNPRRTGLLDALEHMGGRIAVFNRRRVGLEPVGDVEIRAAPLVATTVSRAEVPRLVDELPLLALAATHARGETVIRGVGELRVKETDRVEATATALRALGARVTATDDELRITGVPARPRGARIDSGGDHRIAMLAAVAGLTSRDGVVLDGADAVAVSFPGFFEVLDSVSER